jgi:NAD(P)-dependent dehydrogenase (short-subunit alcohol dehydrogenase family)
MGFWLTLIIVLVVVLGLAKYLLALYMKKNPLFTDLKGKNGVITGGTSGFGKATVLSLFSSRLRLIFTGRDRKRAEEVIQEMLAIARRHYADKEDKHHDYWTQTVVEMEQGTWTKNTEGADQFISGPVQYYQLELSCLAEGVLFAAYVKKTFNQLNLLINNSGSIYSERKMSKEGLELTCASNWVGPFNLINQLLDLIRVTPRSRIINLSSCMHRWVLPFLTKPTFQLDDIFASQQPYDFFLQYGRSKASVNMLTKSVQKHLEVKQIDAKCVCIHPGISMTNFLRGLPAPLRFAESCFDWLMFFICNTTEQGCQTTLKLSHCEFEQLKGGAYYWNCEVDSESDFVTDSVRNEAFMEAAKKVLVTKSGSSLNSFA